MKRTPLYEAHLRLGGRMVEFAGYALPLQYTSIVEEHLAVRREAGVFDVSHMGEFLVRGEEALPFLQWATVNDAARLKVGRAQYSMLPSERGGVVDDIYLYRLGEAEYLMVVNAANIAKDLAHLQALAEGFRVEILDRSEATALLALQGPKAESLLQGLTDAELQGRKKNDVFRAQVAGRPALLARTGYTGEDGFELFLAPEDAEAVFLALVEAGAKPCGLGARDTLRLEAGFPLYGHELTDTTNPLCTPWAWVVKREKDFLGKEAMLSGACRERLVGLVLETGIPREGYRVFSGEAPVGRVTSGGYSPLLEKGIALAYVEEGAEGPFSVEVRGRRVQASLSPLPFVPLK
ncbi:MULTISPECIES: glycine cleavage system aminomethyltransferase GcvT [Thermus]|jgi:aminomethyltransferase|uniref:Aminomethyltransferase n=1 Tax=Thermus brockianus TaxID=56956 RepID=A0A1J0LUK0_THEBO|nr:glycine cleavage system aminomethyltransferase GcvT [Thermus brockianus]APD09786.1 glycine cleavage system aminomethyltransferase T [Thermus brockianus]BDG16912.1 aminomethyltransferase [Thermus brockianus]